MTMAFVDYQNNALAMADLSIIFYNQQVLGH